MGLFREENFTTQIKNFLKIKFNTSNLPSESLKRNKNKLNVKVARLVLNYGLDTITKE